MHGLVHRSLKEYVIERAGREGWEIAADVAGVETRMFLPVTEYPDEQITAILEAVARLAGHSVEPIQRDFGRYFAPELLDTFEAMIPSDLEGLAVVEALDRLYPQIVATDGPSDDVEVETSRPDPDTVVVEYTSDRDLGAMVEGIVRGIAEGRDLDTEIEVDTEIQEMPGLPDRTVRVRRTS